MEVRIIGSDQQRTASDSVSWEDNPTILCGSCRGRLRIKDRSVPGGPCPRCGEHVRIPPSSQKPKTPASSRKPAEPDGSHYRRIERDHDPAPPRRKRRRVRGWRALRTQLTSQTSGLLIAALFLLTLTYSVFEFFKWKTRKLAAPPTGGAPTLQFSPPLEGSDDRNPDLRSDSPSPGREAVAENESPSFDSR